MSLCSVPAETYIFKQNTIGDYFYIIKSGKVEIRINDKVNKYLDAGESFGELALLHGSSRSASIKSLTDCLLWTLERKNFRKIIDHINYINYEDNKKFIYSVPILNALGEDLKSILCSNLIREVYEEGTIIIKEGEVASCLYIVKDGEIECDKNSDCVRILKKGEYFGEKSILLDCVRTCDVIAKTKCVLYSISLNTFKELGGENFRDLILLNFIKGAFTSSKCFYKFNLRLLEEAFECFKLVNYNKNDVVAESGYMVSSKLIIVIEGALINV